MTQSQVFSSLDMKMLEVTEYNLYEIHESGERSLGPDEKPLLVQVKLLEFMTLSNSHFQWPSCYLVSMSELAVTRAVGSK